MTSPARAVQDHLGLHFLTSHQKNEERIYCTACWQYRLEEGMASPEELKGFIESLEGVATLLKNTLQRFQAKEQLR